MVFGRNILKVTKNSKHDYNFNKRPRVNQKWPEFVNFAPQPDFHDSRSISSSMKLSLRLTMLLAFIMSAASSLLATENADRIVVAYIYL